MVATEPTSATYSSTSEDDIASIQRQINSIKRKLDNYAEFADARQWPLAIKSFFKKNRAILIILGSLIITTVAGLLILKALTKKG